jgi:hypothetical protein
MVTYIPRYIAQCLNKHRVDEEVQTFFSESTSVSEGHDGRPTGAKPEDFSEQVGSLQSRILTSNPLWTFTYIGLHLQRQMAGLLGFCVNRLYYISIRLVPYGSIGEAAPESGF